MWWNYVSIPKFQRCSCLNFGMDKWFHPTLYWLVIIYPYLYSILTTLINGVSHRQIAFGMKINKKWYFEGLQWYRIQQIMSIYTASINDWTVNYASSKHMELDPWLVCDLNRTPIVMAKHGGSCVHFSGISTCGRTSQETVSHPQHPPLPTLCKISLPVYVIVTNERLQPLTATWYNSLVLSISLLKI